MLSMAVATSLLTTHANATQTEDHIATLNATKQEVKDFILNNYQNHLQQVYNTSVQLKLNNDMIAEVLSDSIPGLTGQAVASFFTQNGFDGNGLGFTTTKTKEDLVGDISADKTLTADKVWRINGMVTVNNGATLTIEAGTTIIGQAGTGASSSYLVIDKGSKIMAEGTATNQIIFTSETSYDGAAAAVGQWGSLVVIGNAANDQVKPYEVNPSFIAGTSNMADNSGVLKYVAILNSGITIEENKELNGLSMVGVGSGTLVDHITVAKSDDDCIELWGGTVNLSNLYITGCTDDHFDIDDGFSGTVSNMTINQDAGGYAGIEMSGNTAATFDGLTINVTNTWAEGGIFFKKDGIGGTFKNVTINYDIKDDLGFGAIHSVGTFDAANTTFTNVTLKGSNASKFTGDSATELEALFDAGTGNSKYSFK